jgi:hypothetical protein
VRCIQKCIAAVFRWQLARLGLSENLERNCTAMSNQMNLSIVEMSAEAISAVAGGTWGVLDPSHFDTCPIAYEVETLDPDYLWLIQNYEGPPHILFQPVVYSS